LEPVIRKLRTHTLKSQLDVCQLVFEALVKELQSNCHTPEQKSALAHRSYKALKERRSLQRAIDILEGREPETETAEI